MPELILMCVLIIPQLVAGVYAHGIGKSFWFWFFISFVIPIILLVIDNKKSKGKVDKKGYQLADHVRERQKKNNP
ncbi:MAG: hypothetical protein EOO93_01075 [Pedobacter sp.]|nr:MAG: hypothetical protein EOO93_01075 [Pedobacter sp.]